MKLLIAKIFVILAALVVGGIDGSKQELWCYNCNTEKFDGSPKRECNDPYTPAASNLIRCPQNETQTCFKSLIFYKHVHVTVRGCAPATAKSTYCSFEETFPEASLECLFCDDNACNTSPPSATSIAHRLLIVALTVFSFAYHFVR